MVHWSNQNYLVFLGQTRQSGLEKSIIQVSYTFRPWSAIMAYFWEIVRPATEAPRTRIVFAIFAVEVEVVD